MNVVEILIENTQKVKPQNDRIRVFGTFFIFGNCANKLYDGTYLFHIILN